LSNRDSQRAVCDLPHPVRTAQTAITGTPASSIVRLGPNNMKSAPAAKVTEALCMTSACSTSLYAKTTWSTFFSRHSAVSSASSTMGMPSGYRAPARDGGYRRPAMSGICAAVKAITSAPGSSR
jgi:hypothetical protein